MTKCWICGTPYENSWHVCPLDKAIVSILREHNAHITSEFNRCANSSAGSTGDPEGFLHPIPRLSPTAPSTSRIGTNGSGKPTEDKWWTAQDLDTRYLAEMEDQLRQWEDDER